MIQLTIPAYKKGPSRYRFERIVARRRVANAARRPCEPLANPLRFDCRYARKRRDALARVERRAYPLASSNTLP